MKNIVPAAFFAILAAATVALVYAYTRPARFQLVSARVLGNDADKDEVHVFLVDTLTGRIWSYSPGSADTSEAFYNIGVDGLHGREAMGSLRRESQDIKELLALWNSKELREYQELKKAKAEALKKAQAASQ
jgi:hypothetical protein